MKNLAKKILIGIVFFGMIFNLPIYILTVYNETTSLGRHNDIESNLQSSTLIREDWSDFSSVPLENLTISHENNLMIDKIHPLQGKWINMNPSTRPSPRIVPGMAYDLEYSRVILFGGYDGNYDDETWAYNYATNNWTNLNPPTKPGARYGPAMAYNSEHDKIILFGGYDGGLDAETWAYDYALNKWTNLNPPTRPSGRDRSAMVYDSKFDKVILFGGWRSGGFSGETWMYDYMTNNWTNMNPPTRPSGRYVHTMAYNSKHNKVILFGGNDGLMSDDTWVYDYATNNWTNMNPFTRPGARVFTAMVYDSEQDKMILFGGDDGNEDDETWAYDYETNTWTNLSPPTKPSPRDRHAMAYDSEHGRVILFGGDDGTRDDETWALEYEIYPIGIFKSNLINLYKIYNISGGISWTPENQPEGTVLTLQVGFSNTTNDEDFIYTIQHDSSFTFQGVGQYIRYSAYFESGAELVVSPILNSVEMFFVEKSISDDDGIPSNGNGTPGIPGFNILILFGIVVAVSAFLIRKRHQSSL